MLGLAGGLLSSFVRTFRYYIGGYAGSGKQWVSWISIGDEVTAIRFLMENESVSGIFNLTSPGPVRMKEFWGELGRIRRRPVLFRIPKFAVRAACGKIADELILAGQRVLPRRLLESGFSFEHENIKKALSDIID